MNKEAKEHLFGYFSKVETKWCIIGGLFGGLLFDIGLFIGIMFSK